MKIAVLALDEVFDSGLTTVLDTLHTANELAALDARQATGAHASAGDALAPTAPAPPFELQVVAKDLESFSGFIRNVLLRLPNVKDVHTTFSLGEVKASSALPLPVTPANKR